MFNNDDEWKEFVRKIARTTNQYSKPEVQIAADFLWNTANWSRLKETDEGCFIRECSNVSPDVCLRTMYRDKLKEQYDIKI